MDKQDTLSYRTRFYIPENTIYVDGNSLGLLSQDAETCLKRVLNEWKKLGIRGWLEASPPWFYYAETLGKMGSKLVGAQPEEVVVTGTTTVNLHSLVSTFYTPTPSKNKILADELNFPTDLYALQSQVKLKGFNPETHLVLVPSNNGRTLDEDTIVNLMNPDIALIVLPSVLYKSGQLLDMEYLTKEAHTRNILIGFDCSHSVGVIPHFFDTWEVDFAFWCSYKYLNGGPGSTAFLYVNKKHFGREPALAGWFGYKKDKQFDMLLNFEHAHSAGGWQISSPSILSTAPLEGALSITLQAGINNIRKKSLKMTSYCMFLVDELLSEYGFTIGTPRDPHRRGGHIAVEHKEGFRINEALKQKNIIPDFRPPHTIRIAPIPLYNTYHEIWEIVQKLKEIMKHKEYTHFSQDRKAIT